MNKPLAVALLVFVPFMFGQEKPLPSNMDCFPASTTCATTSTSNIKIVDVYKGPVIILAGSSTGGTQYLLEVRTSYVGDLMVRIDTDGKTTYGEKYKADDAAKAFWQAVASTYPEICKFAAPTPADQPKK